jgi:hypothetical protein
LAAERAVSSTLALQPLSPDGGELGWGVATIDGAADGEAEGDGAAGEALGLAGADDGEAEADGAAGDALGLAGADDGEAEADGAAGDALGLAGAADGDAATEPQLIEATVIVACEADSQMYPNWWTWPAGRPPFWRR